MTSESTVKKGTDWGKLILGILLIITSLISFNNPNFNVLNVVVFFGIAMIASGIQMIASAVKSEKSNVLLIILGVITIILGILIIVNIWYSLLITPYFFAIWCLVQSISGLFTLGEIKKVSKGAFWFSLIMNILGILIGLLLFYHPVVSYFTLSFTVGMGFMFFGIKNIAESF
ncbi:DUF308 domain-containing protein [Vagococcus sp. BWB3-3]|uniref:DUF308 domain-containing protein n=1 Tax=Vagococcus allomyrinae TaxID=2794353 RepID=A0A940SUR0_9ENTE|nr:DUF308 domain-containing protein [Vagococcus allomyrinae]MBP1040301.1 DUF308 domain-containing protein [Vagococcus allomyrinae]